MELDWSTFLLEILNFLILVWILKRFLYRPVMNAIAERKKGIEKTLQEAESIREAALELKSENEKKLAEWEKRKETLESDLAGEISERRDCMLAELEAEFEMEKERKAVLEARHREEWRNDAQERALDSGAKFASSLLARLASPELESGVFDAFIEDLGKLDAGEVRARLPGEAELSLAVSSAFPFPAGKRDRLVEKMGEVLGRPVAASFSENPDLLCGIRVGIGPWVLQANLRDELAFFRGTSRDA